MLQGDGINIHTLKKILDAVLENGYSAEVRSQHAVWSPWLAISVASRDCIRMPTSRAALKAGQQYPLSTVVGMGWLLQR